MGAVMLRAARRMIRELGLVGGVLLALVFALPAFESHACAAEPSYAAAAFDQGGAGDDQKQCPDCGPACAGGCCHAPHAATAPDVASTVSTPTFSVPAVWTHRVGRALDAPGGPERPPRF